jgi:hypothetical protein
LTRTYLSADLAHHALDVGEATIRTHLRRAKAALTMELGFEAEDEWLLMTAYGNRLRLLERDR